MYDVIIVGGGPAGLAAALILGRGRKRVLLCDAGPPRNAAAEHIHGFVTRDGTPPAEFRRIGREQLTPYPSVEVRFARVDRIEGEQNHFTAHLAETPGAAHAGETPGTARPGATQVAARRVLLATGMIDELPSLPGLRELWGRSVFQCPYCHAWEIQGKIFGTVVSSPSLPWLEFPLLLRGWTDHVVLFTDGKYELPAEPRERLVEAGIRIEEQPLRSLITRAPDPGAQPLTAGAPDDGAGLEAILLADGSRVGCDALFVKPPQRQTALVASLGLDLDEQGFVRVNERRQTSRGGILAAGDLTSPMQAALPSAASGAQAAYLLNHELTLARFAAGH